MYSESLFRKNLTAFSHTNNPLGSLLSETEVTATILHQQGDGSNHFFVLHRTKPVHINPASYVSQSHLDSFVSQVIQTGKKKVVIIGAGTGEHIAALLRRPEIEHVCVLEKNVSLIRLLFGRIALADAFKNQKADFVLPLDFIIKKRANYKDSAIIAHPVLGACYHDVSRLVLSYDNVSSIELLLDGSLMIDDWHETLSESGHFTYVYPPNMYPVGQILKDFSLSKIAGIWSINRIEGVTDLASKAGKPYVIYEIDPDISPIPELPPKHDSRVFTFRKSRVDAYKAKNWQAAYLPLATNQKRFEMPSHPSFMCELSFAGASMLDTGEANLAFLEQLIQHPLATYLITQFREEQLANPEEWKAPSFLEAWKKQGFSEFITVKNRKVSVLHFVSEWSGACNRVHFVKQCGAFGIHVWGDPAWEQALKGTGAVYHGFAKHKTEIPLIYASSKINIDITRVYQPDVATLRLFDVIAAQKIVLTNLLNDNDALFSDPGLLRFQTAETLQRGIEEIQSWDENQYENYTFALKKQLQEHHTFQHRLQTIQNLRKS